jgi:hypothetical protein
MVASREVSRTFLAFLEESAEDEIKYSRIQDKESHHEALQIYKGLLRKGESSSSHSSQAGSPSDDQSSQPTHLLEGALSRKPVGLETAVLRDRADDAARKNKVVVLQGTNSDRS